MRKYSYRKVRNHWVAYRIKEQTWAKWFLNEEEAALWVTLANGDIHDSR